MDLYRHKYERFKLIFEIHVFGYMCTYENLLNQECLTKAYLLADFLNNIFFMFVNIRETLTQFTNK